LIRRVRAANGAKPGAIDETEGSTKVKITKMEQLGVWGKCDLQQL